MKRIFSHKGTKARRSSNSNPLCLRAFVRGKKRQLVCYSLNKSGFDVMTVRDQNLCGSPDPKLIEICNAESRCLVTLDADFADTLKYPPENYAGIAVIRLPKKPKPEDIETALVLLVGAVEQGRNIKGKLWIVSKERIRQFERS